MDGRMDMIRGPLLGKILRFAFPIIMGSVLQQLFSAVDIAVVGMAGDSGGQAAIGANTSLIALFVNFFVGLAVGINVVIGNYIGQGHKRRISDTVHTAVLFATLSGLILCIVVEGIGRLMLQILSTPEDVLSQAVCYLRIYALGMPFILLYNFGASVLRTVGDTKRPLYALMISGAVNMLLDILLVVCFGMGVAGVAAATAFSNVVSAVLVLLFLGREKGDIRLSLTKLKISFPDLLRLLRIGLPAGLQTMVFSVANLCIQSAINSYGADAVAGNAIALIFEVLAYYVVTGFDQAAVTFTSQNYGAGELGRCRRVLLLTMASAVCAAVAVNGVFIIGKQFFAGLFTADGQVMQYVFLRFRYVLVLQFMICSYEVCGSVLRGLSHSLLPAVITIFGTCVLRIVWVNTVCEKVRDIKWVFIVYPVSWAVTGIAVTAACVIVFRKLSRKAQAGDGAQIAPDR